eukprot:4518813-Pleurochrysis_carterae.AAC.7
MCAGDEGVSNTGDADACECVRLRSCVRARVCMFVAGKPHLLLHFSRCEAARVQQDRSEALGDDVADGDHEGVLLWREEAEDGEEGGRREGEPRGDDAVAQEAHEGVHVERRVRVARHRERDGEQLAHEAQVDQQEVGSGSEETDSPNVSGTGARAGWVSQRREGR